MEKSIVLQTLDQHWKEHLLNLDHLRQGINLRAFGQRDPLNEYKTEAFAMFEVMLNTMRESITSTLSLVEFNIVSDDALNQQPQQPQRESRQDPALMGLGRPEGMVQRMPEGQKLTSRKRPRFDQNNPDTWGSVPRNAPCPCGSGKKFKQCHGDAAKAQG